MTPGDAPVSSRRRKFLPPLLRSPNDPPLAMYALFLLLDIKLPCSLMLRLFSTIRPGVLAL